MEISTIRGMILITIILLIISEIFSVVINAFSILGGIIVIVVYAYCAKKARESGKAIIWFTIPTVIFTLIPMAIKLWPKKEPTSLSEYLLTYVVNNFSLFASFLIPVGLLAVAYYVLKAYEKI